MPDVGAGHNDRDLTDAYIEKTLEWPENCLNNRNCPGLHLVVKLPKSLLGNVEILDFGGGYGTVRAALDAAYPEECSRFKVTLCETEAMIGSLRRQIAKKNGKLSMTIAEYMPSNLQASVASAQFDRIDELVGRKMSILRQYKEGLASELDLQLNIESDHVGNGAWATTLVMGDSHMLSGADLRSSLEGHGIASRPFFYPMSLVPAYKKYMPNGRAENPNAYRISENGVTLHSHYFVRRASNKIYNRHHLNDIKREQIGGIILFLDGI